METDLFSVSIAFSTGITCMPMPAPPGGTIGVTFSSGRNVMRSKNAATSGCSSICDWRMLTNSALPGTNCGSVQRFSWFGFFPSRFSQLYSTRPMYAISVSSFSSSSSLLPVIAAICAVVFGLRTFILSATSAISSVTTPASPQYSGSLPVTLPMRSVIIAPSLRIFSLGSSVRGIVKEYLLSSTGIPDLVCLSMLTPPHFISLLLSFALYR